MGSDILFSLKSQRNPRVGAILRGGLFTTAIMVAGTAALLPRMGVQEPKVAYGLMAVALMDVVLAFVLPPVIEKQTASVEYRFFGDRLEIAVPGQPAGVLPYENIVSVDDVGAPRETENGLTTIRLTTARPAKLLFFGMGTTVHLAALSQADSPGDRIKEVVEKSLKA